MRDQVGKQDLGGNSRVFFYLKFAYLLIIYFYVKTEHVGRVGFLLILPNLPIFQVLRLYTYLYIGPWEFLTFFFKSR